MNALQLVVAIVLVAFAALVALAFMVAAGEMIWRWRRDRHRHPPAIDVDWRAVLLDGSRRRNGASRD